MASDESTSAYSRIKKALLTLPALAAAVLSSAQYWVNSDVPSATSLVIRYVSETFWPELLLIALVLLVLAWVRFDFSRAGRYTEQIAESVIYDVRQLAPRNRSTSTIMRGVATALIAASALYMLIGIAGSLGSVIHARASLLVKYSRADLMKFLEAQSANEVEHLQFHRARAVYEAAVTLYGSGEKTTEMRDELSKIDRYEAFALAATARAEELERENGPNRHSLYLYALALPLMPDSNVPLSHLVVYKSLLDEIGAKNRSIQRSCEEATGSMASFSKMEFGRLAGFVSASRMRAVLSPDGQQVTGAQRFSEVCLYVQRFEPVLHSMDSERHDLEIAIEKLRSIRAHGVASDDLPATFY